MGRFRGPAWPEAVQRLVLLGSLEHWMATLSCVYAPDSCKVEARRKAAKGDVPRKSLAKCANTKGLSLLSRAPRSSLGRPPGLTGLTRSSLGGELLAGSQKWLAPQDRFPLRQLRERIHTSRDACGLAGSAITCSCRSCCGQSCRRSARPTSSRGHEGPSSLEARGYKQRATSHGRSLFL